MQQSIPHPTSTASATLNRRGAFRRKLQTSVAAYGFLAPFLIVLVTFTLIAVIYAFYLSFFYVNFGITIPKFVGWFNYKLIWYDLTHQGTFYISLINGIWYTAGVVSIQTVLALMLAIMINQKIRFKGIYRTLFYLPSLTSSVAISLIFIWLYKPNGGINYVLSLIHIKGPNWLSDPTGFLAHIFAPHNANLPYILAGPSTALIAIILLAIWTTAPTFMLIYLAALQDIPDSLYEAARIDGANEWQLLRNITIPLLRPTTFLVVALGTIGGFQVFDQIYVMQGPSGGPINTTIVPALTIYNTAFTNGLTGLACAEAVILFVVIFALTVLQRRFIDTSIQY